MIEFGATRNRGDRLIGGTIEAFLYEGDYLESNNGQYLAILQTDQNFVVYKVTIPDLPS